MKRYVLRYWMLSGLLALVGGVPLMAQDYKPELRVGLGGYQSVSGIWMPDAYQNSWIFYPSIQYATPVIQNKMWMKLSLGYGKNLDYHTKYHGYGGEYGSVNLFTASIGLERKHDLKLACIYYGADFEYEWSIIDGILFNDVYPFQTVLDFAKGSLIIEPYLGVRKELWSKFVFFIETSLEFGFSKTKSNDVSANYPASRSFSYVQFNPINMIGVGYIL